MNEEEIKMGIEEGKSIRRSKGAETQEQNGESRSTTLNSVTVGSASSILSGYSRLQWVTAGYSGLQLVTESPQCCWYHNKLASNSPIQMMSG